MKRVRFHPEARRQAKDSALWYEHRSPGLGDRFQTEVEAAVDAIRANPDTGFVVVPPFQMKTVKGFPYGVVFVDLPKAIWIIAVHHHRQDRSYWSDRLADVQP
jgi:toxin ParE1/3/4